MFNLVVLLSVVAFLVALHQNKELLGSNGLLPIPLYFNRLRGYFEVKKKRAHYKILARSSKKKKEEADRLKVGSGDEVKLKADQLHLCTSLCCTRMQVSPNVTTTMKAFNTAPSLLWWVSAENMDTALDSIALAGLALSGFLVIWGAGNAVLFTLLWVLYHSLVNVGQRWYVRTCTCM